MKTSLYIVAMVLTFSCAFWSCATIMNGTSQKIGISSTPTGAKVTIDNKETGVTPVFADLKRGNTHLVRLELDGYEKSELTITKSTSGWVWGNIVFGGLIGLAVDAISGSLYKLSPEQLNAELRKQSVSQTDKDGTIYILTVLQPKQEWEYIGHMSTLNQ